MSEQRSTHQEIEQWRKTWPKIVARAWADSAFMAKLVSEPVKVLQGEYKLPVFDHLDVRVTMGKVPSSLTLVIPPKPEDLKGGMEDVAKDQIERSTCTNSCTF